ncbi:MAG: hypothetical protein ACXWQO_09655 [Bdellovibrionota bacterium]
MNKINAALALSAFILASQSGWAATLECSNDAKAGFKITGIGTEVIEVVGGDKALIVDGKYGQSADHDCDHRKGFDCYEEGQTMINIPVGFAHGVAKGKIFVNTDTDDRVNDKGVADLGDDFSCTKKK